MRLRFQPFHRPAHGQKAGPKDIVDLDLLQRRHADGPMHLRMLAKEVAQLLAALPHQHLGIVEIPMLQAVRQNGRRGENGTRPAPAADLIHSGDDGHAFRA
jgi:hypothetical protein